MLRSCLIAAAATLVLGCSSQDSGGGPVGPTCASEARLAYGGGRFVLLHLAPNDDGFESSVTYSDDDGLTWKSTPRKVEKPVDSIAYGDSTFLATGDDYGDGEDGPDGYVQVSTDAGATWHVRRVPGALPSGPFFNGSTLYFGPLFVNGAFMIATQISEEASTVTIETSADLETWTSHPAPFNVSGMSYGAAEYVAWGQSGAGQQSATAASADGVAWTTLDAPWAQQPFRSLTHFNGGLVGAAFSGGTGFTADRETYATTLPVALDVAAFGEMLVGVDASADGDIYTTTDGSTWTQRATHQDVSAEVASSGIGVAVAASPTAVVVATGCSIQRSTDGVTFATVE